MAAGRTQGPQQRPSGPVTLIDRIDAAQQCGEQRAVDRIARLELMWHPCPLEHVSRQFNQWSACRLCGLLDLTSAFDSPHSQKRLRRRAAANQQAVVTQN